MPLRILMLGDVVSDEGTGYLLKRGLLRKYISDNRIDFTIANGENSAPGNGITYDSAAMLLESGVDLITGGNHSLRRKGVYPLLDDCEKVLRPDNFGPECPGTGRKVVDVNGYKMLVVNLMAPAFISDEVTSPFRKMIRILEEETFDLAVVDFHGETTSEKLTFARYFDGKVSAIAGTHTHVATADIQILPKGTGYITDLGMCGSHSGVLGVRSEDLFAKYIDEAPVPFTPSSGETYAEGAVFVIDPSENRCTEAYRVKI